MSGTSGGMNGVKNGTHGEVMSGIGVVGVSPVGSIGLKGGAWGWAWGFAVGGTLGWAVGGAGGGPLPERAGGAPVLQRRRAAGGQLYTT